MDKATKKTLEKTDARLSEAITLRVKVKDGELLARRSLKLSGK